MFVSYREDRNHQARVAKVFYVITKGYFSMFLLTGKK